LRGELLIAAGPGEWRAALLEDGVAVELYVERGDRIEAGSIHLGRVRRLVPALGAALIDIGDERPAFLPRGEFVPRGRRLDEGEQVVVQILRAAQGGKAARATMGVALRGKLVELIIGRSGIVGGDALSAEERADMLGTLTHPALRAGSPPGASEMRHPTGARTRAPRGRTAGEGAERSEAGEGTFGLKILEHAPPSTLATEAAGLWGRWREMIERVSRLAPPARLDPAATFAAALARLLPATPACILVDEPAAIPEIRRAFPDTAVACEPEAEWPIDLDAVFEGALSQSIALDGGGSVHFEATRAAVLIDVDTGTPQTGSPEGIGLAVNLAAAGIIARQIRLRNLGGGIVVDFVGLDSRLLRERVRAALAAALMPDPAGPQVLGWTRLGHFELVRPRRNRPLAEALLERRADSALVKTASTVAHEALRRLRREARAQPGRSWRVTAAPDVAAALSTHIAGALEQRFGRDIAIAAEPGYDREHFQVAAR